MSAFLDFKDNLLRKGLEFFGLYYGTYAAIVTNNADPENRGRIMVCCPEVWQGKEEMKEWILPRGMYAGKKVGMHFMPQKDDTVWLTFRGGRAEPEYAMWEYGWWVEKEAIPGAAKDVYIVATPKGHSWVIDEANDKIYFSFKNGKVIEFDKSKISLGTAGGSAEAAALGDTLKKYLEEFLDIVDAHAKANVALTVPTAFGPSGTPINGADFGKISADIATLKAKSKDILSQVVTLD